MSVRLGLAAFVVLAAAFLLAACGDDDGSDDKASPGPSRTAVASPSATPTPAAAGPDQKTPGPPETPGEETPGSAETPPPVATTGKPSPRVQDVAAFFTQFANAPEDERLCVYNPSTRVIDCADRGLFAPDPPLVGQGVECFLMTTGGTPVAVRCEVASPQGTTYYDVR